MLKGITISKPLVNAIINDAVVFRGDGSAKFGERVTLMSAPTNNKGKKRIVDVLPCTGRVKVIIH